MNRSLRLRSLSVYVCCIYVYVYTRILYLFSYLFRVILPGKMFLYELLTFILCYDIFSSQVYIHLNTNKHTLGHINRAFAYIMTIRM